MASGIQEVLQHQILEVAKKVEDHLDSEIEKLENLDIDDIEKLREKRKLELKKLQKQKQEWLASGHGDYNELAEEKEFFEITKKSPNIVCHFYKDGSPRCKIVDHHLKILCLKHIETRFCKINVEKAPFLTDRLRIKVIPTIALVKDSKTKDYIVGFTDLGNHDEFSTDMLEWRIAQSGAINYHGDLLNPPDEQKIKKTNILKDTKKSIRGRRDNDESSDDDFFDND